MFYSTSAHSTVQHRSIFSSFFSMYSIIFILWIVSNIMADRQYNSTDISIEHSCLYCQTTSCHCLSNPLILNCSFYLLDLPSMENCSEMFTWQIVNFSFRNLSHLNSKTLLSLRMHQLFLSFNSINIIETNIFNALGDILFELDLSMNKIFNVSSNWLNSNLVELKILNLAWNQLKSFSQLDNIQLPKLEYLNLSHNTINHFPSSIHRWTSLITLDLSFNELSTMPRFSLMGLNNLTWLSLASNRNLTCVIQDSFKYLKSLKYLDLSSTNLYDLDACIFVQLIGLKTLLIEHLSLNCTSCWLLIARKNALRIFGQCLANDIIQQFDTLTDHQLDYACLKTSINCSKDYCEPGSIISNQLSTTLRTSSSLIKMPLKIAIVGVVALIIVKSFILLIIRWRKDGQIFCCHLKEKLVRRDQRKHIIDRNPAVIESVVTHGANMNLSTHSHHNSTYVNDETSKNKRKLYNPMFADSPTLDIQQRTISNSNDDDLQDNSFYSERL